MPNEEGELKALFEHLSISTKPVVSEETELLVLSKASWNKIASGDVKTKKQISHAIENGIPVIMLDAGVRDLGQGYPNDVRDLGPLQGVARVTDPKISTFEIINGLSLIFTEAAEPESHIHPAKENQSLWSDLPKQANWLWNGLRGGLIVPASDMTVSGLRREAFVEQWKARGTDEDLIPKGNYFAYELQGFYAFSSQPDDEELKEKLKQKVQFLVEDAPALASAINPSSPVQVTDLFQGYQEAKKGVATKFTVLVNAGKNLTRTPVVKIDFGEGKGKLIVSQLLTAGRLHGQFGDAGLYGIRYDEATVQMVLNMMSEALKN